ncbi:Antitoxin HigA [Acaryochloris thomasi RCC1774]|uniref:Antitoxin HigA n=1 Tax=Acaryochloris thomasi RCC1774 TaxID=1764569 RepID=A0A2W1JA27_9CYAN|nr:HigA family addiction module antitoxin [Acaryochloris thomasi]PZD71059.1 Antitoxin HigA [Acaryochloris thomasi RCC1774]
MRMHDPAHPGEILQEFYMEPYGLSARDFAKRLGVSHSTVARVVSQQTAVSADMALRLEKAVGLSAETWLGMQKNRDLWLASQADTHEEIEAIDFDQLAIAG